jgi:hypothetical protein
LRCMEPRLRRSGTATGGAAGGDVSSISGAGVHESRGAACDGAGAAMTRPLCTPLAVNFAADVYGYLWLAANLHLHLQLEPTRSTIPLSRMRAWARHWEEAGALLQVGLLFIPGRGASSLLNGAAANRQQAAGSRNKGGGAGRRRALKNTAPARPGRLLLSSHK